MNALYSEAAAESAAGPGFGWLDGVSDNNSVLTPVDGYGHLKPCHELLHDVIAFGMNDQVCLPVLGSLLQVDDDKLSACKGSS